MDEEEIKKLRKKKKKEIQEGGGEDEKLQEQVEEQRKQALRQVLTKDAMERFGRVKLADPQVAQQLETYLVRLKQAGQVREKISEEKLKNILKQIQKETKQDWNIKRR